MPRRSLAAILSWLTLVGMVLVLFTLAYFVLGAETVFRPVSFEVTTMWASLGLVLNLVAAVVAGVACIAARGDMGSLRAVTAMVIVFGIIMAVQAWNAGSNPMGMTRLGDVGAYHSMLRANYPIWALAANPLVVVAGLFAGARLWRAPTEVDVDA